MKETEPGKGIVDFKSVINILKESGYNGYYGLEFGATSDDSPMVAEAIDYISSLM